MSNLSEEEGTAFSKIFGEERAKIHHDLVCAGNFGAPIYELAREFAIDKVWTRPGLNPKQRSLVTIAILVAQGHMSILKTHIQIGIANGLSVSEIEEVLTHALVYVGVPAVINALTATIEELRDLGLVETKTLEESGYLRK